jgi:acetylornithine deacetylase/succinyl-diaminopimelate desuccinylase-like protein
MRTALFLLFPIILVSLALQPQLFHCEADSQVAALLDGMSQARWVSWIGDLSGEREVTTDSGEGRILTRSRFMMFEPGQTLSAFQYIQTVLKGLGFNLRENITVHTYNFSFDDRHPEHYWENLILTFPGSAPELAKERALLVAHLDSTSDQESTLAPGADDNASGAAGLLEAAAVLRRFQLKRTLHLIWFSGEEQSRRGSEYFVEDFQDWLPEIVGVICLDMFAFEWNF